VSNNDILGEDWKIINCKQQHMTSDA
jgi:hypothetical protein